MTGLEAIWRGCANTWECDEMGHLNVRHYLAKMAEGLDVFWHLLGHGPRARALSGVGFVPVDQHIRYQREVRAGTPLAARAGVLAVTPERLRILVEIRRSTDGVLAASIVSDMVAIALADGTPRRLPVPVAQAAAARLAPLPAEAEPKGLVLGPARASASLADAERLGLTEIYRGAVQPHQVDEHRGLVFWHLMGMVSDGIGNLWAGAHPARARGPEAGGLGGAALEYRMVYRRRAWLGDPVVVRSGIIGVTDKTQIFGHWFLDLSTGEAIGTAEAVAVLFDLKARKIIALSEEERARIGAHVVPGLSA